MKRYNILIILIGILMIGSCSEDFLTKYPQGLVTEETLATAEGVNSLLTGAYSMLDGYTWREGNAGYIVSGPTQWGADVASDDLYKGERPGGWQDLNEIEQLNVQPTNSWVTLGWLSHYDGIARANDCIRVTKKALEKGTITASYALGVQAEATFLRTYHHFLAQLHWYQVPYITEDADPLTVSNDHLIWDELEADIQFCIDNLPSSQTDIGRVTRWAALAMKARMHLMQNEYAAAKPLLDEIINNGGFTLMDHFWDNFDDDKQNNAESIFEIQYAVNDGSKNSQNGSWDHCVSYPTTAATGLCCDYQHPSMDLYNAFKVDSVTGLPLLDNFQDDFEIHDQGVDFGDTWIPPRLWLDPRVDWTICRRGIPVLDYGIMTGSDWANEPHALGGPFTYKKVMFDNANRNVLSTSTGWAKGVNANNWRIYRLAHVMLWRAEVAVEENDLATALSLVNQIRARAADDFVMGKVSSYSFGPGDTLIVDYSQPADNYLLGQYPSFPDQDYARKAIRHEWRLEAGIEGFRWYDLRRWGIMDETMKTYVELDVQYRDWLIGVTFDTRDAYLPLPQEQIDLMHGVLVQDPNY